MMTGRDVLMQTLRARDKSPDFFARLARDTGIPSSALQDFKDANGSLSQEQLVALAGELYDGAGYDAEHDLLRKKPSAPAVSLGIMPPSIQEQVAAGTLTLPQPRTPGSITPPPPMPSLLVAREAPKPREGWAE